MPEPLMDEITAVPIKELLTALLDDETVLNPRYLYRLSDLEGSDLSLVAENWASLSSRRRRALMEDLEALTERDLLLSYEAISRVAVKDNDPQVRLPALRILWEYESPDLIPLFLELSTADPSTEVRSCAASALGRFVYLGEVDAIPRETLRTVEDLLLDITRGEDEPQVRRSALESLGFSSRKQVPALIESAFNTRDEPWIASGLFAMGRSVDERWSQTVVDMLENVSPHIRFEAVRAAGELEIADAVPILLDLLNDADVRVRNAVIWSLSQIGGEGVRTTLELLLEDTEDELEASFLEDALDNLNFTEGFDSFALFDFLEDDLDLLDEELNDEDNAD